MLKKNEWFKGNNINTEKLKNCHGYFYNQLKDIEEMSNLEDKMHRSFKWLCRLKFQFIFSSGF